MPRYLVDANLPYRFSLWAGPDFVHVNDVSDEWTDGQIWDYAVKHGLTIVTKDADFSDRAMFHSDPPTVIHIRFGNLRMRQFHAVLSRLWPQITVLAEEHRLIRVFLDRIECVK